jgi:hypothetical protein
MTDAANAKNETPPRCDDCGQVAHHGRNPTPETWVCTSCALRYKEDIEELPEAEYATCECQARVRFRDGKGRHVCQCCSEVFRARECSQCGNDAALRGTWCAECLLKEADGE